MQTTIERLKTKFRHNIAKTTLNPRPYQERIVTKVSSYFIDKSHKSVMIESATGSGKTAMALSIAKLLQQEENVLVIWVAMRHELLSQVEKANHEQNIGVDISTLSMFTNTIPPEVEVAKQTGQKILFIFDECQHGPASSCVELLEKIRPDYMLGLSATPFRTDSLKINFETVVKDSGIGMLIKEGFLSQYDHYTIDNWSILEVVNTYLENPARWGKSIFFFHRIEECQQAAELLRSNQIICEVVTGSSERDEQIANFRTGNIQVLLNCMVLTEGFDCPDLQTVFVRPSCKGLTIQMSGRAFRNFPEIEAKQIVQAKKTKWAFTRTANPRYSWMKKESQENTTENTTEAKIGQWVKLSSGHELDQISCNILKKLAQAPITFLPKFILNKMNKKTKSRININQED